MSFKLQSIIMAILLSTFVAITTHLLYRIFGMLGVELEALVLLYFIMSVVAMIKPKN